MPAALPALDYVSALRRSADDRSASPMAAFADFLAASIGERIGASPAADGKVVSMREQPVGAMSPRFAGHICCIIADQAGSDAGLLLVDGALLSTLVEFAFGGTPLRAAAQDRPPTDLELRILALFAAKCSSATTEALARSGIKHALQAGPIAKDFAQSDLIRRNRPLMCLDMQVRWEHGAATLSLALRRDLIGDLETRASRPDPAWSGAFNSEIARTSVTVDAVIDACVMTLGDIAALAPGDTIAIDSGFAAPLRLETGGAAVFEGRLGRQSDALVVRVDEPCDPTSYAHAGLDPPDLRSVVGRITGAAQINGSGGTHVRA
jgi:flagellar motor switch protein FliM